MSSRRTRYRKKKNMRIQLNSLYFRRMRIPNYKYSDKDAELIIKFMRTKGTLNKVRKVYHNVEQENSF